MRAVLADGFRDEPEGFPDDQPLDEVLSPLEAVHVLDADSSQTIAIEEVRRRRNLLIQGPPGTGKSQTIANIIASAVKDGKRILFVAEKMAALEVVHRRLNNLGLGDMCLEVHSHKANKRALLEGLKHTLELGPPCRPDPEGLGARLAETRARLNEHAAIMHSAIGQSGYTPFTAIGEMIRLVRKGFTHIDFDLAGASGWTARGIEERQALIGELSAQISRMGTPAECAWRGVRLSALLPPDQARITEQVTALARLLTELREAVRVLEQGLELRERVSTITQARQLLETCRYLASAPRGVDDDALHSPVWRDRRKAVAELVQLGQAVSTGRARLQAVVAKGAWSADLAGLRRDLAAHGRSWIRWLNPTYRRARSTLTSMLLGPPPRSIDGQLALLDEMLEVLRAEQQLAAEIPVGAAAFGRAWQNEASDWKLLAEIERWERTGGDDALLPDAPRLLSRLGDRSELLAFTGKIIQHFDASLAACQTLFGALRLDLEQAFGRPEIGGVALDALLSRVGRWHDEGEELNAWLSYGRLVARAQEFGLGPLVERMHDARLQPEAALDAFAFAVCEPLLREALDRFPSLAHFDGRSHDQLVERFRILDGERIRLAAEEVALAHFARLPRSDGALGEIRVLRHEFNKKRRHLPIRKLMGQAGQAVQAIKPVFMMSPLSVAEFLPPGTVRFDLLLIDEASQVEPVDALGAIARAEQMVVVGDDRQLPPTRFFRGRLADDDELDDDLPAVAEIESILGKCNAQGIPQRMLEWHYRSRHPSLIAISNKHFYNSRLCIVPNAHPGNPELGLRFHHLPQAVYDRGASRKNQIEAEAVAQAVMRHAGRHSDLSLGVGCFSVAQRDAILQELEVLRRNDRNSESFFASHPEEPFFVKNLENVQGDERDVILISVGYGRDASGYMGMSFGPVNADGGERRLNVLITRARRRCEVFSSITADDIDLSRAPRPGVAALKAFLKYAETGIIDLPRPSGRDADSVFEEQVAASLEACGYKVDTQVGTAGFFIDLAIRDPAQPGRYLLGVECDGAAYHSARSARDRDRLRQQVLEDQGWRIHRIWSTDWFRQPQKEIRRLADAIEAAKSDCLIRDRQLEGAEPKQSPVRTIERQRTESRDLGETAPSGGAVPYVEADFTVLGNPEPHLLPREQMVEIVQRIVEIEEPIHRDEVARRVTRVCGYARTGGRILDAVRVALKLAVRRGLISNEGEFFQTSAAKAPTVRDRSGVKSQTLRKPEMLPPAEIREAAIQMIRAHLGVSVEEVVTRVSRVFGFQSTSAQLRAAIQAQLDQLILDGLLERTGSERLRLRNVAQSA